MSRRVPVVSVPLSVRDGEPSLGDSLWLGAVARERGRTRVRELVAALGQREGVDVVAVA